MIEQIYPAHADHISGYDWTKRNGTNAIDDMLEHEHVVAQIKHDGERIKMHFDGRNDTIMDSRRASKKLGGLYAQCQQNFDKFRNTHLYYDDKTDNVIGTSITLNDTAKDLGYTVLDGELKAVRNGKDSWSDIVGVIHSLPDRARQLMKSNEFEVKYMVFDCCFYDGKDIRDLPYAKRYEFAKKVVDGLKFENKSIELVKNQVITSKEELYKFRDECIANGYEGCVIKSLDRSYYDKGAYIKAKKFETVDLVVYGYQEGNGKYAGTVGALNVGYYDPHTGSIVHVTDVNCGTDQDRAEWLQGLKDGSRYKGVIEVKCQEITDKSLRHPVYVRYRPDKPYTDCVRESIFKEEK